MELSVAEAAARLGVDDSRARQMLRDGLLPGRRGTVLGCARAAHGRRTGAALVDITHQPWQLVPGGIREQGEETCRLLAAD